VPWGLLVSGRVFGWRGLLVSTGVRLLAFSVSEQCANEYSEAIKSVRPQGLPIPLDHFNGGLCPLPKLLLGGESQHRFGKRLPQAIGGRGRVCKSYFSLISGHSFFA
jgi:hypothetical protein